MKKGQILLGCCDYWEDCYKDDVQFAEARGIECRPKKNSKTMYQGHVTHTPYFYYVDDVVGEFATLRKCENYEDYKGATTVYFDTPCWVSPLYENYILITKGEAFKRKIKKDAEGEFVMIEPYIRASLWNEEPEQSYNLH